MTVVRDGEWYRTALSFLLADDGSGTFLFRAVNSNFFVQRQGESTVLEVVLPAQAQDLFDRLPNKHRRFEEAFPRCVRSGVVRSEPSE